MKFKRWKKKNFGVDVDVWKKKKIFTTTKIFHNKKFSQQEKKNFQHLVDLDEVEVVEVVDDVEVVEVVDDVEVVEVEVVDEVGVFPINLPNRKTNYSPLLNEVKTFFSNKPKK